MTEPTATRRLAYDIKDWTRAVNPDHEPVQEPTTSMVQWDPEVW